MSEKDRERETRLFRRKAIVRSNGNTTWNGKAGLETNGNINSDENVKTSAVTFWAGNTYERRMSIDLGEVNEKMDDEDGSSFLCS